MDAVRFRDWTRRAGIDPAAIEVIDQVRHGDPVRRPRSTARNTAGRWPSRKMRMTIGHESGHVERSAIVLMEFDPNVLEFYEQPLVLRLDYRRLRDGRRVTITHVPDFLVLEERGAFIDEWKDEQRLGQLAERMPERYRRTDDGWQAPVAIEAAAALGLTYRLRSSAEISSLVVRNMLFLRDHIRVEPAPEGSLERRHALRRVQGEPGIRLGELLNDPDAGGADVVLPLIAHGIVWFDPSAAALRHADEVQLFLDGDQAQAWGLRAAGVTPTGPLRLASGENVEWDGVVWRVGNVGDDELALVNARGAVVRLATGEVQSLAREGRLAGCSSMAESPPITNDANARMLDASAADLEEANRRLRAVRAYAAGGDPGVPRRTAQRWSKEYHQAESTLGYGYVGLLPKERPGNPQQRLPAAVYDLIERVIDGEHLQPKASGVGHAYGRLVAECRKLSVDPPSLVTFRAAIRRRSQHDMQRRRHGRRAAYDSKPFHFYLSDDVPPHGDYPWQIVHIDHTKLDIELVDSLDPRRRLGRPWLTLALDAFSRRVLAYWLTFDPPSYRSVMMLLRVMVRRHNRLGELFVLDGGPEFESVYFESLLARYEIEKRSRPAAEPRYGGVIERLFGVSNTELIHNLPGNTKATRKVRTLTPETDPRNLATFDLGTLHDLLDTWAHEIYDTRSHPAVGRPPRDAYLTGLSAAGTRPARLIAYDADFVLSTMPTTPRGQLRVRAGRGVKLRGAHYWHPDFALLGVEGASVPIRYDPMDMRHLWAYVGRRWVEAISATMVNGPARTERELRKAAEEIRQRERAAGRTGEVSEGKLRLYLASDEAEKRLAGQRAADRATRPLAQNLEVVIGGLSDERRGPDRQQHHHEGDSEEEQDAEQQEEDEEEDEQEDEQEEEQEEDVDRQLDDDVDAEVDDQDEDDRHDEDRDDDDDRHDEDRDDDDREDGAAVGAHSRSRVTFEAYE